jgi:fructose transport system substrate-binding protein
VPRVQRARRAALLVGLTAVLLAAATTVLWPGGSDGDGSAEAAEPVVIGLVTSSETNPFAVKMTDGAERAALGRGVTLMTAAGRFDGDSASQVTAIETMTSTGVDGILIAATEDPAVTAAVQRAREAGILVIALGASSDSRAEVDALFGTDDFRAGQVVGEYARAALGDRPAQLAMLGLAPGVPAGVQRHNGFLVGMGLVDAEALGGGNGAGGGDSDGGGDGDGGGGQAAAPAEVAEVVCGQPTQGQRVAAQAATAACLAANPMVDVVFAADDESAIGASLAVSDAGRAGDVVVVSADGGCAGVDAIAGGQLSAVAQQYPRAMAQQGVDAVVAFVREGERTTGFVDTGVTLVAAAPLPGMESVDVGSGLSDCWG